MHSFIDSISQPQSHTEIDFDFPANGNQLIEILEDEDIKKIDAYLEWEQEYYLINQSYLLENN